MANCANGLAFRLACEREAGSAIDRIDDGHVHARVLQRRIYRFAAHHRRGESVKLIRVGGAPGSALYTIAVGESDREPTKRRHRTEHTQLTAVANHLGAQLQQIRPPHRAADRPLCTVMARST
jgi:hypothetical protein